MKIPHRINANMFNEYLPSKVALGLMAERDRHIKAEDTEWEDLLPPRLTEICLRVIVAHFAENRILDNLPCTDRNRLLEILPTDLPLELVLEYLHEDIYWKRMVNDRWKERTNHVEDYGNNWKRMYMERHVQELVEGFTPEGFDLDFVTDMCRLAAEYVRKLDIRQLRMVEPSVTEEVDEFVLVPECYDHIDLSPIIQGLTYLSELHIQFGMRHIGSNYKKMLFKISIEDCRNIGRGVADAQHLKVLRIHQSAFDDDKVIALLSSMTKNTSLSHLEFSNCLVGNDGAIAVARYLRDRKNLTKLNLCNNKIYEAGMEALSYVITQRDTSPIRDLNVRFNNFGNDGFRFLASALVREHVQIERLNVSCCDLNEESGILIGEMMTRNTILKELDASTNQFDESVGRAMERGMSENKVITFLDLRMTGIPHENMLNINKYLNFNRIRERKGEKGLQKVLDTMKKHEEEIRAAAEAAAAEEEAEAEAAAAAAEEKPPEPSPTDENEDAADHD